jgi:hypothetical protein
MPQRQPITRSRPVLTCLRCRTRKLRCDKARPACLRCREAAVKCTLSENESASSPSNGSVTSTTNSASRDQSNDSSPPESYFDAYSAEPSEQHEVSHRQLISLIPCLALRPCQPWSLSILFRSQTNSARQVSRLPTDDISRNEEKEGQKARRNRARISCERCHRLKVKCNRQLPCDRCEKSAQAETCTYSRDTQDIVTTTDGTFSVSTKQYKHDWWWNKTRGETHWRILIKQVEEGNSIASAHLIK